MISKNITHAASLQDFLQAVADQMDWKRDRLARALGLTHGHLSSFMKKNKKYSRDYIIKNEWKEKLSRAASRFWNDTYDREFERLLASIARKNPHNADKRKTPPEETLQRFLHDIIEEWGWDYKYFASVVGVRSAHFSSFMNRRLDYAQSYILQNKWKEKIRKAAKRKWKAAHGKKFDQALKLLPPGLLLPPEETFQRLLHDFATEAGWDREALGVVLGIQRKNVSAWMAGRTTYSRDYILKNQWKEKLKLAAPRMWKKLAMEKQFDAKLGLTSTRVVIPKAGTLQRVIHDLAQKADWNRTRLAEVLWLFENDVSALLNGTRPLYQSFVYLNGWAGKLEKAAPRIWQEFEKDFYAALAKLPEWLAIATEGSIERLVHDFAQRAQWSRSRLAKVLDTDPSELTKFLKGLPVYTQVFIREKKWKERLEAAAPKIYAKYDRFSSDFDTALLKLNHHRGKRTKIDPLAAPDGLQVKWRQAASEFVGSLMTGLYLTETSVTQRIPSNVTPILKKPEKLGTHCGSR